MPKACLLEPCKASIWALMIPLRTSCESRFDLDTSQKNKHAKLNSLLDVLGFILDIGHHLSCTAAISYDGHAFPCVVIRVIPTCCVKHCSTKLLHAFEPHI